MTSASKHSLHRTPTLGASSKARGWEGKRGGGWCCYPRAGRGGLARQAVRVEMTLQELCSRRLQAHLSRDDPATWLKNINVVPCSPQPTKARRTYKQPFDPLCLSLISQPMPSPDTRARSGAGAPSGSASGLNLRWGRRGPLGESEGLCFLWLLWNSLSSPPHRSPPPW